ncbi:hypothetical protein HY485_00380 [Candidatus Woesearchaeota archaeon]|nr:hypothetical protein [Candidatus Woesearchaeota archaeon]
MYFIRYKPEQSKEPYHAPEELKKKLVALGVEILLEAEFFPDIIGRIPEDKVKDVESLDGVVDVFDDLSFQPKRGDC